METKKYHASILAVTAIILSVILVIALSVSMVAIRQKQSSLGSGKSNTAFQNADSGVEAVLQSIRNNSGNKISSLPNCSGGMIVGTGYKVTLQDTDGNVLKCDTDSAKDIANIVSIKSVGTGANQETRAIEAAVAATLQFSMISNQSTAKSCEWYCTQSAAGKHCASAFLRDNSFGASGVNALRGMSDCTSAPGLASPAYSFDCLCYSN